MFSFALSLSGLDAELFYVRHGIVNNFALSFVVPVPEQVDDLTFSWQSLVDVPVSGPPATTRRMLVEEVEKWRKPKEILSSIAMGESPSGNYYHKIFANRRR